METFGERLRARARALGLSDADVARRADMDPRRYGHYVRGVREPDLQTLQRICTVLATTPNHLLGFDADETTETERAELKAQLCATINTLDVKMLRVAVRQIAHLAIDESK